jgi:hypothetical protein
MNYYLTEKQEDRIYAQITTIFESKKREVINCESKYVTSELNYFEMITDENSYTVSFNTNKGKLLKRSVTIKEK